MITAYSYDTILNDEYVTFSLDNNNFEELKPYLSIGIGSKGKLTLADVVKNKRCLATDNNSTQLEFDRNDLDCDIANVVKEINLQQFIDYITN
jgi:hypothetical protein